jgi:hypothetical protein
MGLNAAAVRRRARQRERMAAVTRRNCRHPRAWYARRTLLR